MLRTLAHALLPLALCMMVNAVQSTMIEEIDHPIPRLDTIDVHAVRNAGGSDLFVLIASPLGADSHSLTRLSKKLDNYISVIASSGYTQRYGAPTPQNTAIIVKIHPASAKEALHLIESYQSKAIAGNFSLHVEALEGK